MPVHGNTPRIFVQIASYRDPECHATIKDLFEKAAHPGRIFVGVCWQFDPDADKDCFNLRYPREKQVRVVEYHIRDAKGAGWARAEAQRLWQGEEYTMQIQAHHRFERGWDDTLIEQLHRCPSEKSVLTAWLPGYTPPDTKQDMEGMMPLAAVNFIAKPGDAQLVYLSNRMVPSDMLHGKLLPTCMWVGNFMFARSSVQQEIPFDPYIYFWGEEVNYSARLWTHGYDIFHLNKVVLYHYWDRKDVKDGAMYRDHTLDRNHLSRLRNLHVLGIEKTTEASALAEIEKYGVGSERTLEQYWAFAGINIAERTVEPFARKSKWSLRNTPAPASRASAAHPRIFVAIASHRDPECKWTIRDMFAKAAHPQRVFVGVCLQLDASVDEECALPIEFPSQTRIREVDYRNSKGANWARSEAHRLWDGEEYILQIDSHMRFEDDWDETLIRTLARCPSEKAMLSTYLPNYEPPNQLDFYPMHCLRTRVRGFSSQQSPQRLHISGAYVPLADEERSGLYPSPFFIANFAFARAQAFREVPVDPHFHFYGDEISTSARLWTHGWDIYQPDCTVMYHYWVRKDRLHLQTYRDLQSEDSQRSRRRVLHLLGFEKTDDAQALAEIDRYGLGSRRGLDGLWAFAGVNWEKHGITGDAREGKWNMAARKQSEKKGAVSAVSNRPRMFVQIASYRDPDCQNTVKDLFDKATHPERISVGICWQFVKGEDDICFQVPYPRPQQVRVHEVNAHEGRGVCWARSLTQKLWQGEEFTLQIDSHMRFEPGWDEILLSMWEDCANPKAVLTCYPSGFTPPDNTDREWVFGMAAKAFDQNGIFLMHGKPAFRTGQFPDKPIAGAFASACMYFGPAQMIEDVPYDPNLYFFGEEISLAVRLWTHGYDLFHPNRLCIYHDWDRGKRPTHFSDHKDWGALNAKSFARVKHLLGTEISHDPEITRDLDIYGLGTERTLDAYQAYSGVNFATKTFDERAEKGEYGMAKQAKNNTGAGRIYVQIASYRDPECQWTVKDLFEKAENPDRITVGICWQFDEEEDKNCFEVSTRPDQVRVMPVDWREAEGVCWARHMTQQMWDGEEYTLMIDSHMRFVPGWDRLMIEELAACESPKPLLTCSPAAYTPPNNLQKELRPTVRRVQPFTPDGNIRGKGEMIDRSPPKPLNGAFVSAGFVFSRAEIIEEVPYDPYLYFDQEEIAYAARLYTHGWDVFSARTQMLYHYYNTADSVRPLHWRDMRKEDEKKIMFLRNRGLQRFNHMTGYSVSNDPEITKEMHKYGWGSARSLAQFEEYCGIDFKRKVASARALRCEFIKDLKLYRSNPILIPELGDKPAQKAPPAAADAVAPKQLAPIAQTAAKDEMNPMAEPYRSLPGGMPMLEFGDYAPMFEIEDTNRKIRGMELHAGRHSMLFFLPVGDIAYATAFFRAMSQQLARSEKMEIWQMFAFDDTVENVIALKEKIKTPHVLWADPGRKVAHAFGICRPGDKEMPPAAFLFNHNLKIVNRYLNLSPEALVEAILRDCKESIAVFHKKNGEQRIISELPPALLIPNAFTPEFCKKCIDAFRTGKTFDGTVGVEATHAYRPNTKVRTDFIVGGKLLDEIDEKLSRSVFPEIKKIFGVEITHRELYKIGLYTGEKGGFFKQHRDNFDVPLGYRRIAMTVHLSDNYEGGGLKFPEYDDHVYRPELGGAIAFSCATMHEARPVTKGERFVLVAFMHGQADEAHRRHYLASKGSPLKIKDYVPVLRTYPELRQSRDFFYRDWWDKYVVLNERVETPAPAAVVTAEPAKQVGPAIITLGGHKPKKIFESPSGIVFDDFLPEAVFQRVLKFAQRTEYEHINTKGKTARAWHVHDGFPLRSTLNLFRYPEGSPKPQGDFVYPTNTDLDLFTDHLVAMQPHVEHMIGKPVQNWTHVTATAWLYPQGTGLAMHDDGSGVYTGAYAYFLNPTWRPHWGGLLLLMDPESNRFVHEFRNRNDQMEFYQMKYLHAGNLDELLMEHGMARCIFPKRNRMVFIANDAYHMVTRVNEQAGDNLRMSIAGFFDRKKT